MILLVSAVAKEVESINSRAGVEVLVTGVGPVEAAARVAAHLARGRYDMVVNAGIAGALPGAASVGDGVVVAEEFMEIDIETDEAIVLPDNEQLVARVGADPSLVEMVQSLGFAVRRGITVPRVTATNATAERLRMRGAEVESMEGFAVLRAAELAGVPSIEIRGISNLVGERSQSRWDLDAGLSGLRKILNATLDLVHTLPAHAE